MAISSPSLFIAKAFVLAQVSSCPFPAHAPYVNIVFANEKPKYITTAPLQEINQTLGGSMDATADSDAQLFPGGAMAAEIVASEIQVSTSSQIADEAGNGCVYVDRVQLVVTYAPTVFLAKELNAPGRECRLKMTKDHEERHIAADVALINDRIKKMKMKTLLSLRDNSQRGPFNSDYAMAQQSDLEKSVTRVLKPLVDQLIADRRSHAADIDTPENFKEEKALCSAKPAAASPASAPVPAPAPAPASGSSRK
jgi:hypothetical protein